MKQKKIYLVRHGKTELEDKQRRYIGQIDLPLSKDGVIQAQALGRYLSRLEIDGIFCSDLARSMDTARQISSELCLNPQARTDLREIYLGEWEGLKLSEVKRLYPKEFEARGSDIGYFRPPGGESFADCSIRILAAFHEIIQLPFDNMVIVGHAGINRLLICHILGMPLSNLFRIPQDYACLNIIMAGDSGYRLKLINSSIY